MFFPWRKKPQPTAIDATTTAGPSLLWVDAVGSFAVFHAERVLLGGPRCPGLPLMARLATEHAAIVRCGEGSLLEPLGETQVQGQHCREATILHDGDLITLGDIKQGDGVTLRFRQPSPLSRTACLEFESHHRPQLSVDGVLLWDETCLFGPTAGHHVWSPNWTTSVVLSKRGDDLWCGSPDLIVDGTPFPKGGTIFPGAVVNVGELRFRFE